ncbi:MAG: vitamin K epoxide reductase family protein [Agriterribacter sp.]
MKFINLFSQSMQHCEDATAHLLQVLKIKFTKSHLQKELTEHPNYPALAAIADVIGMSYDVGCAPLRQTIRDYKDSPDFRLPFLAQIKPQGKYHDVFAVVTQFSDNNIQFYNPATKKQELYTVTSFDEIYKGVILIVEAGNKTQEEQYEEHLKKEKRRIFFNYIALLALPALSIIISIVRLLNNLSFQTIVGSIYTLLLLAGCIITTLLLWHETDEYNPVVKQICQATKQINCSAVLRSKASTIMGLSWSSLGFTYFAGILLFLLATGLTRDSLVIAGCLSILVLPYVFFSLYYQWKVVKQWCVLCLAVQALLLLLFVTAFASGLYDWELLAGVTLQSWLGIVVTLAFVFSVMIVVLPALQKAKDSRLKTIELQRLKHNPQIFGGLLSKQKVMSKCPDGLGITIGKPDSVIKLVKVCNPYCGPCAKAHPIIEELVNNNEELSVQIIFTATENEKDIKRAPVMHLLSIAAQKDEMLTQQALDDWYNAPVKDYQAFAEKYHLHTPSNEKFRESVTAMHEWCDAVAITATPTFFVCMNTHEKENGSPKFYRLPDLYNVADLKYFFTI